MFFQFRQHSIWIGLASFLCSGVLYSDADFFGETQVSGLCPVKNSKSPVYLTHPSDCSKFYICDTGFPYLKECHPGLHFNPKINACDYPENAQCSTGDLVKPKGKITEDDDSGLCPVKNSKSPVYLTHPSDCSKFYICDSGLPHLKECHPGLHFNQKINACDYPENAKCSTGGSVKPKGQTTEDDDSGLCPVKNSKSPVYLTHPSDCSKFYICDSGLPHLKECHPGLHFNPKINACDYPENAKCSTGASVKPKGKITEDDDSGLCPVKNSKSPVYLTHPSDCSKFYICDSGLPHLKECHPGLHFNLKINACDYPENAKCSTGDFVKPNGKIMISDDSTRLCPAKNTKSPTYLTHPSDCRKFYICDSGSPHLKECPLGLHFNPKINACDYPEDVECNSDPMRSPGVSSPYCPSRNGKAPIFFRHSTNCSVYYMCGNGLAYEFVCPARLHFNLRKKICDYETTAGCAPL